MQPGTEALAPGRSVKTAAGVRYWIARLRRHRLAFMGLILLTVAVLVALAAPVLAPYDPVAVDPLNRLQPPSPDHWLGTDRYGRDVLSRLIYGTRISLAVGSLTVLLSNAAGLLVGLAAGYYPRIDNLLMRVMDAFMAFPGILLALGIMAILGPAAYNTVIALSIVYTPRVARVVRSSVLSVRETEYIEAARALGMTDLRIILRHILPNCVGPIVVQATFIFAYAVTAEAALSFLGVGTSPEIPSWGNMLKEATPYMYRAPLLAVVPGAAIMATVMALNLLGDGLRDILDPRIREARGADV